MRRAAVCLVTALLTFSLLFSLPTTVSAVTTANPSRIINVVYDDSGSMISLGNEAFDTWCQAKYAMEVFSAMLGERDTMNVYVMSDFEKSPVETSPELVLRGTDGAEVNVSKVHNMITAAGGTPFASVKQAYNDLARASADEKWLVVLTDGEFRDAQGVVTGTAETQNFLEQKSEDISVMFLSIGSNAAVIERRESQRIYSEKAQTSNQILNKITEICTRIFNSDRLEVNVSARTFSFDIPMGELTVFAQGANVAINGVKASDGKTEKSSSAPVAVKYSERAATNYSDVKIARGLVGSIATFKGDFGAGDYSVDVSGAETIEIYYKPNVEIAAYLTDARGDEVTELENLEAGEYTIDFGFVKGGTKEKVNRSKLLGNVEYEARIANNGVEHERIYLPGDKITIEEGSLRIEATASFLEYNSVATSLEYEVFRNKKIDFTVADSPEYELTKEGLGNADKPIILRATIDGNEFSEAQWKEMGLPRIEVSDGPIYKLGDFKIEKRAEESGVFYLYPSLYKDNPDITAYEDCDLSITYRQKHANETWEGGTDDAAVHITDGFSWLERNGPKMIPWLILLLIIALLVIWLCSKTLPRDIRCRNGSAVFRVNGITVTGDARVSYKRGNKTLKITSPPYGANYEADCSLTLQLKPVDKRLTKSRDRYIEIVSVSPGASVTGVTIQGTSYARNAQGRWVSAQHVRAENAKVSQETRNAQIHLTTGISQMRFTLEHK